MPRRLQAATAGDRLPPHMGAAAAVAHGSILSLVLYLPALGNRDGSISVLYSKPGILFGVWACGCPGCKGLTAPVVGGAGNGDMSEAPAVPDAGVRFRRGVLGLILWGTRTPVPSKPSNLDVVEILRAERFCKSQKPNCTPRAAPGPQVSGSPMGVGGVTTSGSPFRNSRPGPWVPPWQRPEQTPRNPRLGRTRVGGGGRRGCGRAVGGGAATERVRSVVARAGLRRRGRPLGPKS